MAPQSLSQQIAEAMRDRSYLLLHAANLPIREAKVMPKVATA